MDSKNDKKNKKRVNPADYPSPYGDATHTPRPYIKRRSSSRYWKRRTKGTGEAMVQMTTAKDLANFLDDMARERVGKVDKSNEQSLIAMVPEILIKAVESCPLDYWESPEEQLAEEAFDDGKPDPVSIRLRIAFWEEYDRAIAMEYPKLNMTNVWRGNCSQAQFYSSRCRTPAFIAWFFQPPASWTSKLKGIAHQALQRMEEAVGLDITNEDGSANTKLIEIQHKILETVDTRLHGAIIQRIHQTQTNVNLHGKASQAVEQKANEVAEEALTMEQIEMKIAQLEKRSAQASQPGCIEVDMMKEAKAVTMISDGTSDQNKEDGAGT